MMAHLQNRGNKWFYFLLIVTTIGCSQKEPYLFLDGERRVVESELWTLAGQYFQALVPPDSQYHHTMDSLTIILGQKLFYDSSLSANGRVSCNTCHPVEKYGMDRRKISQGHDLKQGRRNTPTVLNAFLQYAQFWDARAENVEDQSIEPLLGDREMGIRDTFRMLERLYADSAYRRLFDDIFDTDDKAITMKMLQKSMGAFERTLITPCPLDAYLQGDLQALSLEQKEGMWLFIEKGCVSCHNGILLGGNMAQKFAIYGYYWDYTNSDHYDRGVYEISKKPEDKFFFKVPGLRNVAMTSPYFHDGSIAELNEAIRIMSISEMGQSLSEDEIKKIERFLICLTGELVDYKAPIE